MKLRKPKEDPGSPYLRAHYEPTPSERQWYRSASTSDRGWLVRRDGMSFIRLDRPSQELLRPFRDHDWIAEVEHRPLTPHQVSEVCFAADRALCKVLGMHDLARKEWMTLTDRERIDFTANGPGGEPRRRSAYLALRVKLEEIRE